MDNFDPSPFLVEFLQEVDALSAAFRNLPAEEYEVALDHIRRLLDQLSGLDHSCEASTELYSGGDDSNSDKHEMYNDGNNLESAERRGRRRKVATPRRSSGLYDVESEEEECEEGSSEDKSRNCKKTRKGPKADVVGCQVVTDFKGDERFQCDQCELKFSYYAALLRHLDSRHKTFDANQKIQETNKKAVNCDKCGATLSSKGALHAHMQMHAGVQPYCCDVCNKKFSLKSNLLRHKRIHEGLKPYQCDICHKRFTEKRSVEVHRRIHTGERPYRCDICGMRFSQLGSWMGHRDTHNGKEQTKYKCDICDKSFSQRVGLHNHRKRHHEDNKSHKCSQCNAAFYSPEELRLHEVSHTGIKPYLCAECGKSFARQQTLKNHMKQHSPDEAIYNCHFCPDKFSSTWALSRHKKSHKDDSCFADAVDDVGGLVEDVLSSEELGSLPKDVLAVFCTDGTIENPSHDLLEVITKGQVF